MLQQAEMEDYSFRLEETPSWKSRTLHYQEPGHTLCIDLEWACTGDLDWVGCEDALAEWTSPWRKAIDPAKRQQIVERLRAWASSQRVHVGIGPCLTPQEYFRQMEREGWSRGPSGAWIPPKFSPVEKLKLLWGVVRVFLPRRRTRP